MSRYTPRRRRWPIGELLLDLLLLLVFGGALLVIELAVLSR